MTTRRSRRTKAWLTLARYGWFELRALECGCASCEMWLRDADRHRADDAMRTKHGRRFPHSHLGR